MANSNEERDKLRKQREETETDQAKAQRRKLMIGYLVAGVLVLVIAAGVVVAISSSGGGSGATGDAHVSVASGSTNGVALDERTGPTPPQIKDADLDAAAKAAGCVVKTDLPNEGSTHLPVGSKAPNYKTNPPTSGNHVEPPFQQADGAYSEVPLEIDVVHSLEHGRIAFQYDPNLSEEDQLALRGMYDTLYSGSLLFPNDKMPYAVAATAWQNMIGCTEFKGQATLDAMRDFGIQFGGRGPEPFQAFGPITGPTPMQPQQN